MDIKQTLSCVACLTLSKDMTFRDYAQGAYRMRGIGRGQRIEVLVIPEVVSLMLGDIRGAPAGGNEVQAWWTGTTPQQQVVDIITWLVLNGLKKDTQKHRLLCQQNVR